MRCHVLKWSDPKLDQKYHTLVNDGCGVSIDFSGCSPEEYKMIWDFTSLKITPRDRKLWPVYQDRAKLSI